MYVLLLAKGAAVDRVTLAPVGTSVSITTVIGEPESVLFPALSSAVTSITQLPSASAVLNSTSPSPVRVSVSESAPFVQLPLRVHQYRHQR